MSDLPGGWANAHLHDVCELINGRAYKQDELLDNGKYPVLRVGNFFSNRNWYYSDLNLDSDKYCDNGDLLYAWSASFGPRIWDGGKVIFHYHIWKTRPVNALVEKRFLYHWFEWDKENIKADHGTGSTMIHVTKGDMEARRLALPPRSEQRRIVAKIDSLTGKSRRARDHLDHIRRLVENYKQAILAAAFRGDLTREWRESRHLAASRSVLLGEVAEGFNYGSAAKSAKEGRVPVLRMGNIQDGKLDWSDLVFTNDVAEIAKYGLKEGDVLFNRTNSPALVGKTALFSGEREAIYAGYLIKVRCKPELLPKFLTYCLNAPNGRAYSWEVKTDGVSQSNINAKKLAAFRFDLPSVEEQAEIVCRIEAALSWINRITVDGNGARKLIDHLDQSVLAKAFKGELVPQDPSDEPASALLERIRAERATAPKAKRGRKRAA
jgi:type I restriction enzyme S subunit